MIPSTDCHIETARLFLRPLQPGDVSDGYLSWFRTEAARHITAAPTSLSDLRSFVAEKVAQPDALLLGIFAGRDGVHIGNLKFEPIEGAGGDAALGIFVGSPDWQGRGAGPEAILAGARWLAENLSVSRVVLGVDDRNERAIRAYEKAGFRVGDSALIPSRAGIRTMVFPLSSA